MTEQHECEWECKVDSWNHTLDYMCTICDTVLNAEDVVAMLNEYEKLKRATEALPVDEHFRWFADKVEEAPNLDELEQRAWADCLRAYADILEKEK